MDKALQHAIPFFKSEVEASAFKAEDRIMLVSRDSEGHLVQHPAPNRDTASAWSGRPKLGLAKLQIPPEMEIS